MSTTSSNEKQRGGQASHVTGVHDSNATAVAAKRRERKDIGEWWKEFVQGSFDSYCVSAYERNEEDQLEREEWQFKTKIFGFAWLVRGHPDMKPLLGHPLQARKRVEAVLKTWTREGRKQGGSPPGGFADDVWYEWFQVESDDARPEFQDAWETARYMPGQGPLEQAVDAARRQRLLLPDEVLERRGIDPEDEEERRSESNYEFFIGVAVHLQTAMGDRPITLPVEKLADVLCRVAMTVSRWRKWGKEDGYLVETKEYRRPGRNGAGDATEFRVDVRHWNVTRQRAAPGAVARFEPPAPAPKPPDDDVQIPF